MSDMTSPQIALAVNLLVSLISVHPLWRIFRRAGLPAWPALLIFLPIAGWPLVGSMLAFQRWPNIPPRQPKKGR
jgi:hypothetical protein